MEKDDLIKSIASHLGEELSSVQITVAQERDVQYSKYIDSNWKEVAENELGTLSEKSVADQITSNRLDEIFLANEHLRFLDSKVHVQTVKTNIEASKALRLSNGEYVLFLDTHTEKFLWMMNKSFVYGHGQLTEDENIGLYADIFLHFSTIRFHEDIGGVYKQPKTPPHADEELFSLLTTITDIQETFLLCHELAHVYMMDGNNSLCELTEGDHGLTSLDPAHVNEEFLADKLAVDWVLKTIDTSSRDAIDFCCQAIFLMMRYFMRLRFVQRGLCDPSEHSYWLARYRWIRQIFSQNHDCSHWSPDDYLLEYIESIIEPASVNAAIALKQITRAQKRM